MNSDDAGNRARRIIDKASRLGRMAVLAGGVAGCAHAHSTVVRGYEVTGSTDPASVEIRPGRESLSGSWEIIGKVYAYKRGPFIWAKPSEESVFSELQRRAAALGAEAVLGAHSETFTGDGDNSIRRWASGLAARRPREPGPAGQRSSLVVAVLPPIIPDGIEIHRTEWIQNAALYRVEEKGYYGIPVDSAVARLPEGLSELRDVELHSPWVAWADLILTVEILAEETDVLSDEYRLKASMFSRASGTVVFEQLGVGRHRGLYYSSSTEAMYLALEAVLAYLPDIREGS